MAISSTPPKSMPRLAQLRMNAEPSVPVSNNITCSTDSALDVRRRP
jgi:hypothetical protein